MKTKNKAKRISYKRLYENEKSRREELEQHLVEELEDRKKLGMELLFGIIIVLVLLLIGWLR